MLWDSGVSHTLQAGGIGGGGHSTSGRGGDGGGGHSTSSGGGDGGGGHSTSGGGSGGEGTGLHGLSHSALIGHVTWSLETTAATVGGVVDASVLTATVVAVDAVDGIAKPKIRKVQNKCSRETFLGSSIIAAVQWRTDQNPLVKKKKGSEFG